MRKQLSPQYRAGTLSRARRHELADKSRRKADKAERRQKSSAAIDIRAVPGVYPAVDHVGDDKRYYKLEYRLQNLEYRTQNIFFFVSLCVFKKGEKMPHG